jgi:hypothetical protein
LAQTRKTVQETIQIERKVLRAQCQGTTQGPVPEYARRKLVQYQWRDPSHQIIFEALSAISSDCAETIRAQLPSRLTRMGFPDLVWEDLFEARRLSRASAVRLIKALSEGRRR